jgi:hypothetical protein
VIDYAKLAEIAKAKQDAGQLATKRQSRQRSYPNLFFERVKTHIVEEMDKANAELRKRGAETIIRNYMPSYSGKICLTYGTYLLCCVEFEAQAEGSLIKAVISGPPNGYEIARKEYSVSQDDSVVERHESKDGGSVVAVSGPDGVAEDIISSILVCEFG